MKTVTLQIGNSDDKLSQKEWNHFVKEVQCLIEKHTREQHFFGGSPNWYPWQNVAWVFVCDNLQPLKDALESTRKIFKQESVAWTVGETEFI